MVFKGLSVMVAGHVVTVEIDEGAREGRMVLTKPKDGRVPTDVEMEALAFSVSKLWLRASRVHPDKRIASLTREQLAKARE